MKLPPDPELKARLARHVLHTDLSSFTARAFSAVNPGETFTPAWHVDALCHALEHVYEGKTLRLLITMPPRHLKSICTSVAFPAWALGKNPALKFVVASYGGVLAAQQARDFHSVIEAPFYRRAFPHMSAPKRAALEDYKTALNGGRLAVSVGGAVTGLGGHILIADDLMKASDAWSASEHERVRNFFTGVFATRLNNQETGRMVVVAQRLHENDLPGYLIEQGGFTHLNLPAIAPAPMVYDLGRRGRKHRAANEPLCPALQPLLVLERIRAELGPFDFAAQYQQEPGSEDSRVLRWNRIVRYEQPVERAACRSVVQSWDTATSEAPTAAFSVCSTWGHDGEAWKLLDVYRARLAFPDLVSRARALRDQWRADLVLVEDASSGRSLVQSLRRDKKGFCHVVPINADMDKESRLAAGAELLEDGRARLPLEAPWLDELRRELLAFPGGKFSDQVDSVSQFLRYASTRRAEGRLAKADGKRPPGRARPIGNVRRR
jgi:predicted phage terminase large subunit-like protein